MSLGAFSVSLAVADLAKARAFYETLGFVALDGAGGDGWQMMRCGPATIGLFQGMFEDNILTFNPGWVSEEEGQDGFEDIRAIQARLEAAGLTLDVRADPEGTGPAHVILTDPDGNTIMLDQHVPAP